MHFTYRAEYVRCCNPRCRSCPHGPYWYGYYREGKRLKKRYFGKIDPREAPGPQPHPDDSIFSRATATAATAFRILGIPSSSTAADAKSAYRKRCKEAHPDRGGSTQEQARVNTAWSYLRAQFGW